MNSCVPLTVRVLCVIAACSGLRLSLHRDPHVLSDPAAGCGVLRCEESTWPASTAKAVKNHRYARSSFSSINSMTIFRKISVDSSLNAPDKHEVLVAIITSQNLSTTNTGQGLQGTGVLNSEGATLLFDLNQQAGCNAEFMCEVQGVNNQGEQLVSTTTLQPQPEQRDEQKDDGGLVMAMFVQLLSQFENRIEDKLDSKLDSFENRMEDKLNYQIIDKLYALDLKVSTNCIAGAHSRAEPARNTSDSLEVLVKKLQSDHLHSIAEFSRNMSGLLTSVESRQNPDLVTSCSQLNFTEAIGLEIFTDRLFNESLSSQRDLLNIARELKAIIYNSTVEALSSVRDSSSVTAQGITGDLQSDVSSTIELKSCKKGMQSVQPQNSSYPYPVFKPTSESGLTGEYLCDTVTDGGGWIVIQRRTTGHTNFTRGWADYKEGFGPLYDDFWLGNENIHTLTSNGTWELRVDLECNGNTAFATYTDFSVGSELGRYWLSLGYHDGTLADSLSHHYDMAFSTFDNDNDWDHDKNCAASSEGRAGWWYRYCYGTDLNGVWGDRTDKGIEWAHFRCTSTIDFTEMKIRRMQ